MGQYYRIVNIDKKEYMSPSDWGEGLKLMEFAHPLGRSIVPSALVILLADGNNRGGGDLRSNHLIIGSWKYDRIAVVGDYADEHLVLGDIYDATENWKNVSKDVLMAMSEDPYFAKEYGECLAPRPLSKIKSYWIPKIVKNLAYRYPQSDEEAITFFTRLYENQPERDEIVEKFASFYKEP